MTDTLLYETSQGGALWREAWGRVIHHSDQRPQYTSLAFGKRCRDGGIVQSVGNAYDNAMCESFFATLECEPLNRRRFRTPSQKCRVSASMNSRQRTCTSSWAHPAVAWGVL